MSSLVSNLSLSCPLFSAPEVLFRPSLHGSLAKLYCLTLLLAFVFPLFCLPLRLSVALYGECDEL